MAVLALAVVGAAIAPAGYAAIGWSIGALAGQFLFQKKLPGITQEGPRIGDTRVQAATYGVSIIVIEGTMRAAGNIIWTSGIRETVTQTTEEVGGGKGGGGGQEVTTTTYTYDVDLAIGLCAPPVTTGIIGVRRIWANGTLIYNVGDTTDTATIIASNQNAQNIRFYLGTETQLADPTIEAALGAGNVPGYRGLAYAVFTQLALAPYGNSIPNFEFEIVSTGASANLALASVWTSISASGVDSVVWDGSGIMMGRTGSSGTGLVFWDSTVGTPIASLAAYSGTFKGFANSTFGAVAVATDPDNRFWALSSGNINNLAGGFLIRFTPTGTPDKIVKIRTNGGAFAENELKIDSQGTVYWREGTSMKRLRNLDSIPDWDGTDTQAVSSVEDYATGIGSGYGPAYLGPDGKIHWLLTTTGTYYTAETTGVTAVAVVGFNTAVPFQGLRFDQQGRPWCAWQESSGGAHYELKRFDPDDGSIQQTIVLGVGASLEDFCFPEDGFLWLNQNPWTKRLVADGTLIATVTGTSTNMRGWFSSTTLFTVSQANATVDLYIIEPLPRITASNTTTVGDAVGRLCEAAGLSASDYDVSDLTDTLYGYVRGRPMTARSAIEPLARAFYFDAIESDSTIKFVKRGAATPVVIDQDDFARTDRSQEIPELDYVRADEIGAPRQVTVNFFNRSADYLDATEYARRLVTRAQEQIFVDLPLALTPNEASQIADVLLYNSHAERTNYRWSTGPKFIKYEPTDVFSITVGTITHVIRAIRKQEAGLLCQWEGLADYQSGYTSDAVGATDMDGQDTIGIGGPTTLQLLDIPLLRDIDDDAGHYAAMRGQFAGWNGSQLFSSPDNSAWEALGAVATSATMGYATTALGNFYGGNVFDEANSVTVNFQNGTPASLAELDVLNGGNVALLNNEIIQFKTATLVSGTTYTLTGLLRGRRGTESAMAEHSVGDRFILLKTNTGLMRAHRPSSEIGVSRYYRAPAFGTPLSQAQSTTFTNNAVGLKPLSPVYLNGARNSVGGDLIITWIRRGRIVWGWLNFADVPLGETTESYEIDILDSSGTVLRTLTSSTETVTYTTAQQTTDFGSAQASIRVKVYQLSATVGRGFAASGTL